KDGLHIYHRWIIFDENVASQIIGLYTTYSLYLTYSCFYRAFSFSRPSWRMHSYSTGKCMTNAGFLSNSDAHVLPQFLSLKRGMDASSLRCSSCPTWRGEAEAGLHSAPSVFENALSKCCAYYGERLFPR